LLLLKCVNVCNSIELCIFAHLEESQYQQRNLIARPGLKTYGSIQASAGLLALRLQIEI